MKGSRQDGFYNRKEWWFLRNKITAYWKRNRLPCSWCGEPIDWGAKKSWAVDHIKNRRDYPELALEPSNLTVVHQACNARKYVAEEKQGGRPLIGPDGFPVDSDWSEGGDS